MRDAHLSQTIPLTPFEKGARPPEPRVSLGQIRRTNPFFDKTFRRAPFGARRFFSGSWAYELAVSEWQPESRRDLGVLFRRLVCNTESVRQDRAGRSLPAAEARSLRPAGPLRACTPPGCDPISNIELRECLSMGRHCPTALFCAGSIAQRLAGRSLGAAEARSSRPAGSLRACPPQAATRFKMLNRDIFNSSFLIAPEWAQQPAAAPGRRAAPIRRRPVRWAAGLS